MVFSPEALTDLERIEGYIAIDRGKAARRIVDTILSRLTVLESFPEAGRARPDVHIGIRSWPIDEYVVFYRLKKHVVEIVRIVHGRRDVQAAFVEGR